MLSHNGIAASPQFGIGDRHLPNCYLLHAHSDATGEHFSAPHRIVGSWIAADSRHEARRGETRCLWRPGPWMPDHRAGRRPLRWPHEEARRTPLARALLLSLSTLRTERSAGFRFHPD
jgi:hypothetical protein